MVLLNSWRDGDILTVALSAVSLIVLAGFFLFILVTVNKNPKRRQLVNHRGMLCGDPFCPRCKGWYTGFIVLAGSIVASSSFWIDLVRGVAPYAFISGLVAFILLAPVHGAVGRLIGDRGNNATKMVFGVLSALSLVVMIAGLVNLVS